MACAYGFLDRAPRRYTEVAENPQAAWVGSGRRGPIAVEEGYRLDQLPSRKRHVVETLLYAAILTLIASHALLDALRRRLGAGRSIPPLRWAAVFDALAPGLLVAVLATFTHPRPHEDPWLLLLSQATDPNLARPSALVGRIAYAA